jgi:tetratricopeptide (TPR) repeat protein
MEGNLIVSNQLFLFFAGVLATIVAELIVAELRPPSSEGPGRYRGSPSRQPGAPSEDIESSERNGLSEGNSKSSCGLLNPSLQKFKRYMVIGVLLIAVIILAYFGTKPNPSSIPTGFDDSSINKSSYNNKGYNLYQKANEFSDEALKEYPDSPSSIPTGLDNSSINKSSDILYEEANKFFDRALEEDPDYALAWGNKGKALEKLGRKKEADEAFAKARSLQLSLCPPCP